MKRTALAAFLIAASSIPGVCAGYDDLNSGISAFNAEQNDSAISWFTKALEAGDLVPDQIRIAHLNRGFSYNRKGETEKAIADFTAVLAIKPHDKWALSERVLSYLALQDKKKAVADLALLAALNPNDPAAAYILGCLNWELGRHAESAAIFSRQANTNEYAWLWLQLNNVTLGEPMTPPPARYQADLWPNPLIAFFQGKATQDDVMSAAQSPSAAQEHACEANFFPAMLHAAKNEMSLAEPLFSEAVQRCESNSRERSISRQQLEKITAKAEK